MPDYRLQIRDGDGSYRGEIDEFASFQGTVRVNDVGSALLTLDANHPTIAELLAARSEIVVVRDRDERIMFGGPVQEDSLVVDGDGRTVTTTVKEETQWLNWRICHPYADDPNLDGTTPGQDDIRSTWFRTDLISTILYDLVDVSVGPAAAERRRVATFLLAADPLAGPSVTLEVGYGTGRVYPVIQEQAGRHGLWVAMIDGQFTIRAGVDRSATVVFETEQIDLRAQIVDQTHSLVSFDYRLAPPTSNMAFTVSDVDGSNVFRDVVEITDAGSVDRWGWIEAFDNESDVARSQPAALAAAGAAFLEGEQGSESVDMAVIEGPVYGDDYELGDLVTARLTDTLSYVGRVTQIGITADTDGWRVAPALGERVLLRKARYVAKVDGLETRITRVEGA